MRREGRAKLVEEWSVGLQTTVEVRVEDPKVMKQLSWTGNPHERPRCSKIGPGLG